MSTPYPTISDFGGSLTELRRYADENDERWSAFNPSIAQDDQGNTLMLFRSSNYWFAVDGQVRLTWDAVIRNRTWVGDYDPKSDSLSNVREVIFERADVPLHRGPEDGRLFWREDGWYFMSVLYEPPTIKATRIALFKLDPATGAATFVKILAGVKTHRAEKNWMPPTTPTVRFDYVYSPTQVHKDDMVVGSETNMRTSTIRTHFVSHLRGGSQLVAQEDGTYLAVVHDVTLQRGSGYNQRTFSEEVMFREYRHYLARYDLNGRMIEVTPPFVFKRQDTIEFAAGMIEDGDDLLISFGAIDIYAYVARVPKEALVKGLRPIE